MRLSEKRSLPAWRLRFSMQAKSANAKKLDETGIKSGFSPFLRCIYQALRDCSKFSCKTIAFHKAKAFASRQRFLGGLASLCGNIQIRLQTIAFHKAKTFARRRSFLWRICQDLRGYQIQLQTIAFHKAITFVRRRSFLWRICQDLRGYQIQLQTIAFHKAITFVRRRSFLWWICQGLLDHSNAVEGESLHQSAEVCLTDLPRHGGCQMHLQAKTFAGRRRFLWWICQGLWDCSNAVEGESLCQSAKVPWRISQSLLEYQNQLQTIALHKAKTFASWQSFLVSCAVGLRTPAFMQVLLSASLLPYLAGPFITRANILKWSLSVERFRFKMLPMPSCRGNPYAPFRPDRPGKRSPHCAPRCPPASRRNAASHTSILKRICVTLAKRGSGPLNERRTFALAFAKIA